MLGRLVYNLELAVANTAHIAPFFGNKPQGDVYLYTDSVHLDCGHAVTVAVGLEKA